MTEINKFFEPKTRPNGEAFYTLTDDRPDWLHEAVREAHDDEWPNDWRFDKLDSIAGMIDDGTTEASEIADSLVDVYNIDLLRWLADDLDRIGVVDEAVEEFGWDQRKGIIGAITLGQYACIERMARILLNAVEENPDDEPAEHWPDDGNRGSL